MTRAMLNVVLASLCAGLLPSVATARGAGMIFGIDLGGAVVSGETNIPMKGNPARCPLRFPQWYGTRDLCDNLFRTDAGSGFGFSLRLGYNFFGYATLETYALAHFNTDSGGGNKLEGAGHWGFLSRYLFLEHVPKLASRWYDPYVYFGGGGIGYMGYYENFGDKEMRGWKGGHILFGLGSDFYVNDNVSFGLDFKFYRPFYKTYIYDWDDDINFDPVSQPVTLVFMPMTTITFHFMAPSTGSRRAGALVSGPSAAPVRQPWE